MNQRPYRILALGAAVLAGGLVGCTKHTIEVQPIKVEPIHMTVDITIRVDRELEEFFDFEDEYDAAATAPATAADVSATAPAQGGA